MVQLTKTGEIYFKLTHVLLEGNSMVMLHIMIFKNLLN